MRDRIKKGDKKRAEQGLADQMGRVGLGMQTAAWRPSKEECSRNWRHVRASVGCGRARVAARKGGETDRSLKEKERSDRSSH